MLTQITVQSQQTYILFTIFFFCQGSDEFKGQPLCTVDDRSEISQAIERIQGYRQMVECLRPLVKCRELVVWIKEQIKSKRDTGLSCLPYRALQRSWRVTGSYSALFMLFYLISKKKKKKEEK